MDVPRDVDKVDEARYWYEDQDGRRYEFSHSEILKEYFPYWCEQMKKVGREHLISEEACLEDWITVNWAQRV